jgi:hypothetical protein
MDKVSEVDKTLRQIPIDANDSSVGLHLGIKTARHSLLTLLIERLEEKRIEARIDSWSNRFSSRKFPEDVGYNKAVRSCIKAVKGLFGEGEK